MGERCSGAARLPRALARGLAVAGLGAGLWLAGELSGTAVADEGPPADALTGALSATSERAAALVDGLPPVPDGLPPVVGSVEDAVLAGAGATDVAPDVVPVVDAVTAPVLDALDRIPAAPVVRSVVGGVVDGVVGTVADDVVRPALDATSPPIVPAPPVAPAPPAETSPVAESPAEPQGSVHAATPAAAVSLPAPGTRTVGAAATRAADDAAAGPARPLELPFPPLPLPALPPAGSAPSSAAGGAGTDLPAAAVLPVGAAADGDRPSGAPADGSAPSLDTPEDPATSPD